MAKNTQSPASKPPPKARTFDARDKILGRLATEVATALRGKDTPAWRPHIDSGRVVVITNTDHVRFTGSKLKKKIFFRHTQRKPGAVRSLTLRQRMEKDSRAVVREAVWNMLPKNKLRHRMIARLGLYRREAQGSEPGAGSR